MNRSLVRASLCAALAFAFAGAAAAQEAYFGPKQYTIEAGKPQRFSERFAVDPSATCAGRAAFTLVVTNAGITSATVSLNGTALLRESDFATPRPGFEVGIDPLAENELVVELKGGQPGSVLTVAVRREVEDDVFAPPPFVLTQKRQTFQATFPASALSDVFALTVLNGTGAAATRVQRGSVVLNGTVVVPEHELTDSASKLRKAVRLQASNTVVVEATGDVGDSVTIRMRRVVGTSCGPQVAIESPSDGATVNTSTALVRGTLIGPAGTGVSVNGIAAEIDLAHAGGSADPYRWWAQVQLTPETTALEAVATAPDGVSATENRAIALIAQQFEIVVRPSVRSGITPLSVEFTIVPTADHTVTAYELDLDGDGTFERTQSSGEASFTYAAAGAYVPRVRATTDAGLTSVAETVVVAHAFPDMNALLIATWNHFTDVLAAQDVERAIAMLVDENARRRYGDVLRAIRPDLPQYVQSIQAFRPMWIGNQFAHYLLTRVENGTTYGYHVYLARDTDGLWKVMQF